MTPISANRVSAAFSSGLANLLFMFTRARATMVCREVAMLVFCLLPLRGLAAAPPLTLPSNLKGVEYFPRGHAWWNMLYDWYTPDCSTTTLPQSDCVANTYVYQIVQNDLATLAANGVNLIHLYLWDQDSVTYAGPNNIPSNCQKPLVSQGCTEPGFVGWDDGGPQSSPGNQNSTGQWYALTSFISAAKAKGIWVVLHFAIGRVTAEMINGAPAGTACAGIAPNSNALATCLGGQYATWVNTFISTLETYQNVLVWGIQYGISGPGSGPGLYPSFWQAAYPSILTQLGSYSYSSPSGRALAMLESGFGGIWPPCPNSQDVQPILSLEQWTYPGSATSCQGTGNSWYSATGYQWNWREAPNPNPNGGNLLSVQDGVSYWQNINIQPDMWAFQMYNASAADLEAALECVAGIANSVCASPAATIPFSKMLVSEVATGSSFANAPIGNGLAVEIDSQDPTTTAAGQAQWLTDTLCVFARHGIPAFGWYGLYDSASWWEANFNFSGAALAADGYWGLSSEFQVTETSRPGRPSSIIRRTARPAVFPLPLYWPYTQTRLTTHRATSALSTTPRQT